MKRVDEHSTQKDKLPLAFVLRRLHSIIGLWLVIYLCEHLLVNSQMFFASEDQGEGFIRLVNKIHALPFLHVIELVFIGLPFLIHGLWGVIYARTAQSNCWFTHGTTPALTHYPRNHAYTWERYTAWILLVGIVAHVIHMRFVEYPMTRQGETPFYTVVVNENRGLEKIAQAIKIQLYTQSDLAEVGLALSHPLKENQRLAVSSTMGPLSFLIVRAAFQRPIWVILYSIFVIAAAFHAFNGVWTLLITWGITLTQRSQQLSRLITSFFMFVVMALGLMAIWGTYFTFWWKN